MDEKEIDALFEKFYLASPFSSTIIRPTYTADQVKVAMRGSFLQGIIVMAERLEKIVNR